MGSCRKNNPTEKLRIKKILQEKPKILVIMASIIRQNYSERCEALINKQINMEFHASYVYMAMGYYFERDDVALLGFAKFFKKASGEEREHGTRFMEYQGRCALSIFIII